MDATKHYHPSVGFCFFVLMVVLSLASMQPAFQCLSFVTAVSYAIAISGFGSFLRGNWWLAVLITLVTLFNGIFVGRGLTVLFVLNLGFMQTPVTVESLVYGVCMGLMLANVILWFRILGKLSSMRGFIELFTRVSPTVGMMLARITVFIPELVDQARLIGRAQRAFTPADPADPADPGARQTRRGQIAQASALSSHLMEWGMEKSLITANSMVARGYGSRERTSYHRTQLTRRDLVPLGIILALGLTSLACVIWAGMHYQFYPYLTPLTPWWGYLPFVLLCLMPMALQLSEELAWQRSR